MSSKVISALVFLSVSVYLATPQTLCGPNNLQCIEGQAECINDKCVCRNPPYVWGDGYFGCYRRNQVVAETRNDPALTTFNNETFEFPYPCRYLMTHVRQELKDANRQVIGNCEFKIHAFNKRAKGKVYTHGFDVAVKINYDNGTVVERSVRKYGDASAGVNNFVVQGVHDYRPNGPWTPSVDIYYKDEPNNIRVKCIEDEVNNQLVFEFKQCGVRATLVPYDIVDRRNQKQIPGLSVAINCAMHPVWLSKDVVMGLPPHWQGGQLVGEIVLTGLTESQSLVDRAFRSGVEQNQPDANPVCEDMKPVMDSCNAGTRQEAYAHCWWMLTQPRYIKCISQNGLNFVNIFKRCVSAWCQGGNCPNIITDLQVCNTVGRIPILTSFLAGDHCPSA